MAGYRVRETLLQQSADGDAVGRTEGVTGTLSVDGEPGALRLVSTQITVDMTTLHSDRDQRDGQMRGRGTRPTLPDLDLRAGDPDGAAGGPPQRAKWQWTCPAG